MISTILKWDKKLTILHGNSVVLCSSFVHSLKNDNEKSNLSYRTQEDYLKTASNNKISKYFL